MKKRFLAGLSHAEFLRRHWQKKPLFAGAALREYAGAVTREQLFDLAESSDVESRIVVRARGRWQVREGPFTPRDFERLPRSGWTLLVQGVDHALPEAQRLLREFAFLPSARVDDVMVSYAAPGGGVGPHFDSYDVFLVQGAGRRRWQISTRRERKLVRDAPLRLIEDFRAEREWTVDPGDVLYLPPGCAHDGVALGECITYSVGFRAPSDQELAARFLEFLDDRLALEGRYADPDLKPTRRPGRIPSALVPHTSRVLQRVRWSAADVREFTGRYLSEPKPHVVFQRPRRPLTHEAFVRRASARGVALSPASRMLFDATHVFMNGEAAAPGRRTARELERLANSRTLVAPLTLNVATWRVLYEWYAAGYIEFAGDSQ